MEDYPIPNVGLPSSPRCITYSISFCENLLSEQNDRSDTSNLLLCNEHERAVDESDDVPALTLEETQRQDANAHIDVPGSTRNIGGQSENHARSYPVQVPSNARYKQHAVYGSLPFHNSPTDSNNGEVLSPTKRLIYCVHGKPSGCCLVTEGEIIERNNVTDPQERKDSTTTIIGEHCHRTRDEGVDKKARRKLILASILCVIFMIGEVVGGYLSSSLAIATDAAHLLTDFASFMISLFSLWVASRPPTRKMSFGWYRAEVIGALTSVLLIWVVTGVLVYLAVERIINKDYEIKATIMLITSAVGVAVNLVMGLTLHQHSHSHSGGSHGHSHGVEDSTEASIERTNRQNINVRAAFIHVIGDFIQSFGVFVAALVIYFKPDWIIIDPICTFLFSILVLMTTFAIIKDTILVLMEGMPKGVDFSAVMNTFLKIEGVIRVHNLRIWALSLDKTALAAHLAIGPGVSPQKVLRIASRNIHDRFNFFEMTLQIEEFDQNMEDCNQCKCPEV